MRQQNGYILAAVLAVAASGAAYQVMHSRGLGDHDTAPSRPGNAPPALRVERGPAAVAKGEAARSSAGAARAPAPERGVRASKRDDPGKRPVSPRSSSEGLHEGGHPPAGLSSPANTFISTDEVRDRTAAKGMMTATNAAPGGLADAADPTKRIQSPARPFDLDVMAPVQATGSDPSSEKFANEVLPGLLSYIESDVVYHDANEEISTEASLANLTLTDAAALRVYFVADDALYHNSIGLFTGKSPSGDMVPEILFPDASSSYSYYKNVKDKVASADLPLMPGDFVDIGLAAAGSSLDLFVIPDGARRAQQAYGITGALNADSLSHARVLGVVGDSMILIGFEDLPNGGDKDYDDVILAVEVGQQNVQSISARLGL